MFRTAFEATLDGDEESLALVNTLLQIFKVSKSPSKSG